MTLGHASGLAQAAAGTRHACDHDWTARQDGRGHDCTRCRTSRFTVALAQTPADALEVLVDHGGFVDVTTVLEHVEHPAHEIDVRNGLRLIRDLGLATQTFAEDSTPRWAATEHGHAAIAKARTCGHEEGRCDTCGEPASPIRGDGPLCDQCAEMLQRITVRQKQCGSDVA